ncbi:cytochrome P450 [Chondromyces apiculatus]|uniref:Cytochrome P450 n=1 Tax=Chondromyces apiculatus DSM 436 TaxID=1192034 RepID=A0A017THE9_9BACT|nr:cytochrome P450 [Chondromyces apiculatus]EYF08698.1 cytochrome P450 [Chondromyces apiculatus DSM 436]
MHPSTSIDDPGPFPSRRAPAALREYPLLGVLPHLVGDPLRLLDAVAGKAPTRVVPLKAGPVRFYLLTRPEHVEHVFVSHVRNYEKGQMFWKPARRLGGDGLPLSEGDLWLRQRRLLQPLFTPKHLAGLVELMIPVIAEEVEALGRAAADGPIDIAPEMVRIAQRVVGRALFGAQMPAADAEALRAAVGVAHGVIASRMFLFFVPDWVYLPGESALRRAIGQVDEILHRFIRQQRAAAAAAARRSGGLLDLLLGARDEHGEGISDRLLRDEILSMFFAGSETVALTMTWLWHLLEEHPEVDLRMRAEIDEVLGTRTPRFEDLARLTCTRAVIQETMRLYPPGWILPRFSVKDDVVGGCRIPARSAIVASPYLLHRNPTVWDRPKAFEPERFTPERSEGRHRHAFIPFGAGPRVCIGNHLAIAEAQLITALLARRFRPRRVPGHPVEAAAGATLAPRHGLRVRLESV